MKFRKIKGNYIHKSAIINWARLKIGKNNIIGPYCVIGTDAQHTTDKSYGNIEIGNGNIIREFTTIHLPTKLKKKTIVGNNCNLMAMSHIAHDCILEDDLVFSNNVTLGGNTHVMKKSQLGFNTIIHQNQVIGSFSMIGMGSIITKKIKVLPGYIYLGNPAKKKKKNSLGFKKKGIRQIDLKNETKRFLKLIEKHPLYDR